MARISLLGPAYPYRGGIAQFSDRLAEELSNRHEVALYTFSRQYPAILFPGRTQFVDEPRGDPKALPVLDSINPFSWLSTGRRMARFRPEVVFVAYWMPFMIPAYAWTIGALRRHAARLGAPSPAIVLWVHNLMPHEGMPLTRSLTKFFLNRADAFVCLSKNVKNQLLSLKQDATVLSAFHPIYDIFHPAIPMREARETLGFGRRPLLLFFGLVRGYKGLDTLIRAMPGVKAKTGSQLVVADEFYDDKQRYLSLAEKLGLSVGFHIDADIRFVDEYIPDNRVHLYFSAANVIVQPYRDATQSGVVQTAYYFGKPVIVSDVGGLAESVRDRQSGYIVPPEDEIALAEAIAEFFRNEPERLARGAQEIAETFSWARLADEVEAFISDGL